MATVWLAIDTRTGREVAIKRMHGHIAADPDLRRQFLDEGTLGLRLRHPHIVETLGLGEAVGESDAEPFLVLERLQGSSLGEIVRVASERGERVPLAVALTIVRDVARGLHHAHQLLDGMGASMGLVHRDVSPHNVFVCLDGVSKVLDFGIAKTRTRRHHSDPGTIRGKVSYLAPERILGREADARFDVFSLGVVLHELLTGVPLFGADSDGETLFRVLDLPVPAPEALRADLSPAVGALALRALQRDPERRLPSGEALADTIEAVAAAEGVVLGPACVSAFIADVLPGRAEPALVGPVPPTAWDVPSAQLAVALSPSLAMARAPMRRPVVRIAIALSIFSLSAFAAVGVARVMRPPPREAPSAVAPPPARATHVQPAPPTTEPPLELPVPTVAAIKRSKATRLRPRVSGDCGVYFSLAGGKTTVSCAGAGKRKH